MNEVEALKLRVEELTRENRLWQKEAKQWRDMYIEYDEMIEKDLHKAMARIANVASKIKSLDKEINEKY